MPHHFLLQGLLAMSRSTMGSSGAPDEIAFFFNGSQMNARKGASVAAALIENEVRATRTTRIGSDPRGVFCGIGICFDCLVIVDGVKDQRACLLEVTQGMNIETQSGTGSLL
jgi:predicted molibdopterin-dependent oxidoreductase YjgC